MAANLLFLEDAGANDEEVVLVEPVERLLLGDGEYDWRGCVKE